MRDLCTNDLQADGFSPNPHMGGYGAEVKTESMVSDYLPPPYGADQEYVCQIGLLKLRDTCSNYSPPHTLSSTQFKDESHLHPTDSLGFQSTSDNFLPPHSMSDYYNSLPQENYSPYEDPTLHYNDPMEPSGSTSPDFGIGSYACQSPYNEYSSRDDYLSYDDEGPLDLSTAKRGDYATADDNYFGDYGKLSFVMN